MVAAQAGPGGLRRANPRSALRADCPALLGRPARRRTRFVRCARFAQTDGGEFVDEARCARGRTPCAARRLPRAPQPARAALCGTSGGAPAGATVHPGGRWRGRWAGHEEPSVEQRRTRGPRAQRASCTDSARLSEQSERSERREFSAGAVWASSAEQSGRRPDRGFSPAHRPRHRPGVRSLHANACSHDERPQRAGGGRHANCGRRLRWPADAPPPTTTSAA